MNIIGLIAEYNPFHSGHLYQIKKIKELYPNSLIICVISTSFSQRGELSILNKWEKTILALNNDIDIVLELPYFFATQSSDIFAHASLQILNELKIDTLIFGSETNDIKILTDLAKQNINNKSIKKYTKMGFNYPKSLSLITNSPTKPNDILAVSYIKEILKNKYNIKSVTIKRTNDYHDNKSSFNIVSASNIRNKFYAKKNIKKYLPKCSYKILKNKNIDKNKFFELLKYKTITDNNIADYLDVNEGLDNKILKIILKYDKEEDIIKNIKSKRYTYNKIYRMINHILVGLTKQDALNIKNIEYIRILGFNDRGKKYLNIIKKELNYPLIYNFNKKYKTSNYEMTSTKIYSLITDEINLINKEYKKNVIKL